MEPREDQRTKEAKITKVPKIRLTDRDSFVLMTVWRFRFCLGRQIKVLCGFSGERTCDGRLRKLIEGGYLERRKYIYGVPSLYTVTRKAVSVVPIRYYEYKIRLEQILHDISVIDTVIYLMRTRGFSLADITTTKELHGEDGFGSRRHQPDFSIKTGSDSEADNEIAVEVELSKKSNYRFMNNVSDNFMRFQSQIWVIPDNEKDIHTNIKGAKLQYPNIEVISYETVVDYVKNEKWRTEDKSKT
jgi:hypothetical protein